MVILKKIICIFFSKAISECGFECFKIQCIMEMEFEANTLLLKLKLKQTHVLGNTFSLCALTFYISTQCFPHIGSTWAACPGRLKPMRVDKICLSCMMQ